MNGWSAGESLATQPIIGTVTTLAVCRAALVVTKPSRVASPEATMFSKYQSAPVLVVSLV